MLVTLMNAETKKDAEGKYGSGRIVTVTPKGVISTNELKALENPKGWGGVNPDNFLDKDREMDVRLGGGIMVFSNDGSIQLLVRDAKVPTRPLSLDNPSGMGSISTHQALQMIPKDLANANSYFLKDIESYKISPQPTLLVLLSEFYEIIPKKRGDNSFLVIVPSVKGFKEGEEFLAATGVNMAMNVATAAGGNSHNININVVKGIADIGSFSPGTTIIEKYDGKDIVFENVLLTVEPDQRSIEVICPLVLPLNQKDFIPADAEHIGEIDFFDGAPTKQPRMARRLVITVAMDGSVLAYRDGKLLEGFKTVQEFLGFDLSKITDKESYPSSLEDLIRSGKTTGATSKVEKMMVEADKGTRITTAKGTMELDSFKHLKGGFDWLRR